MEINEVGLLVDVQNEVFLPTVIESEGLTDFDHRFDTSQLKLCTFINKIDNAQEQFSHENRVEECIIDHQSRYGFHVFEDHVAFIWSILSV